MMMIMMMIIKVSISDIFAICSGDACGRENSDWMSAWYLLTSYFFGSRARLPLAQKSEQVGETVYSPPSVDRIWLWVYHNKIHIYPIVYLLKGDYNSM